MRRAALIALTAGLLAGCGGGSSKPDVVEWKPSPLPPPPAAARACKASDLRATPALSSSTGGLTGTIQFRNASGEPCSLSGTPTVGLRPKLPQAVTATSPSPSGLPASWLGSLDDTRGAELPITLFNWCFPKAKPTLLLTLPKGAGEIDVPLDASPRCIVAATPTTISMAPFQPAAVTAAPWTKLAVSARIVPKAPSVTVGQTLKYDVILRNTSKDKLQFGDVCPLVRQVLGQSSAGRVDRLNCEGVDDVKPGHSVGFRMQLPIPRGTPIAPDVLTWTLDPYSTRPVAATAQVSVEPG